MLGVSSETAGYSADHEDIALMLHSNQNME
jgi:hypothetical protein